MNIFKHKFQEPTWSADGWKVTTYFDRLSSTIVCNVFCDGYPLTDMIEGLSEKVDNLGTITYDELNDAIGQAHVEAVTAAKYKQARLGE